jgi:glutamate racemase
VIRPTTELIGNYSKTGHVGVLGTRGTVSSDSYPVEIAKFFPGVTVHQQACPMWVPLIENNEFNNEGADYFISRYVAELLAQASDIDAVILACTHYPVIADKIREKLGASVTLVAQGAIVARALKDYLRRHPEIAEQCSKSGAVSFLTTDIPETFDTAASLFYGKEIKSGHLSL